MRDPDKQIRLLSLLPNDDDPLSPSIGSTLATVDRESVPTYVAVSYTWGDPSRRRTICVNGANFSVTENCWFALWQLRYHRVDCPVWIDAICIDQHDASGEKAPQVARMGELYRNAMFVAACVGEHDRASSALLRAVSKAQAEKQRGRISHSTFLHLSDNNHAFLKRPYFSRLWVVQEVLLAHDVQFFCGDSRLRFANLLSLDSNLVLSNTFRNFNRSVKHLNGEVNRSSHKEHQPPMWANGSSSPGILELLRDYAEYKCSDPRDRVYGMIALVNWNGNKTIQPDYGMTMRNLATSLLDAFQGVRASIADDILSVLRLERVVRHLWSDRLEHAELLRDRRDKGTAEFRTVDTCPEALARALSRPAVRVRAYPGERLIRRASGALVQPGKAIDLTFPESKRYYEACEELSRVSKASRSILDCTGTVAAICQLDVQPNDLILTFSPALARQDYIGLICQEVLGGKAFTIEGLAILNPAYRPATSLSSVQVNFDTEDLLALLVQLCDLPTPTDEVPRIKAKSPLQGALQQLSRMSTGKPQKSSLASAWEDCLTAPVTRYQYSSFMIFDPEGQKH